MKKVKKTRPLGYNLVAKHRVIERHEEARLDQEYHCQYLNNQLNVQNY